MTVKRRFLLASALARLILKERGSQPVIEAHFAPSEGRHAHVLFENGTCELILLTNGPDGEPEEERTEVPARQGKFLVDVSAGRIGYNRVRLELGRRELSINCFTTAVPLAVAELEFEGQKGRGLIHTTSVVRTGSDVGHSLRTSVHCDQRARSTA